MCIRDRIYIWGIALPNSIEIIVLYLMGAFLYGIDPTNVSSVLQRIASKMCIRDRMGPYYMAGQKMNNTIIEYINGMEVVKVFNKDCLLYTSRCV